MQEVARTAPLLVTFTGKKLDLLAPRTDGIDVRDIAHALGNICRWGGHTDNFYSVAEHCVHVSYLCSDPRWGLMHDAPEAYLGDVTRPLKRLLGETYQQLEQQWMYNIATALGMSLARPADLRDCDDAVAMCEAEQLMAPGSISSQMAEAGVAMPRAADLFIQCWDPDVAEARFLARWEELR